MKKKIKIDINCYNQNGLATGAVAQMDRASAS